MSIFYLLIFLIFNNNTIIKFKSYIVNFNFTLTLNNTHQNLENELSFYSNFLHPNNGIKKYSKLNRNGKKFWMKRYSILCHSDVSTALELFLPHVWKNFIINIKF